MQKLDFYIKNGLCYQNRTKNNKWVIIFICFTWGSHARLKLAILQCWCYFELKKILTQISINIIYDHWF